MMQIKEFEMCIIASLVPWYRFGFACHRSPGQILLEAVYFFSSSLTHFWGLGVRLWDPLQKIFHKIWIGVAWVPTGGQLRKAVKI